MNNYNYRSRKWFIETYLDEESINDLIIKLNPLHYAYIKHDKDTKVNSDGFICPKASHFHIILIFKNARSFQCLKKLYCDTTNYYGNIQSCYDVSMCYRYLMHLDHNDKFQYSEYEIVSDDKSYFASYEEKEESSINNIIDEILEYIVNTERYISYTQLAKKFKFCLVNSRINWVLVLAEHNKYFNED